MTCPLIVKIKFRNAETLGPFFLTASCREYELLKLKTVIERVLPLSDTKSYCTLASVVFSSGKGNALAVTLGCSR